MPDCGQREASGDPGGQHDPEAVGSALFSLVLGYALQRVITGRPDLETYRRGVRTLVDPEFCRTPAA